MRAKEFLIEFGGRVVKGVNTTADVGEEEIVKQAAKFGFNVDKDGQPPLIYNNRKANPYPKPKKSTPKRKYVSGDYPENKKRSR